MCRCIVPLNKADPILADIAAKKLNCSWREIVDTVLVDEKLLVLRIFSPVPGIQVKQYATM
jgi:hypothetical protein